MSVSDADNHFILDVDPLHAPPIGYESHIPGNLLGNLQPALADEAQAEIMPQATHGEDTSAQAAESKENPQAENDRETQVQITGRNSSGEKDLANNVCAAEAVTDLRNEDADSSKDETKPDEVNEAEESQNVSPDNHELTENQAVSPNTNNTSESQAVSPDVAKEVDLSTAEKPSLSAQASTESLLTLDAETTEVKPKKKRLTLQERLAMAAKAKKKLQAKNAPENEAKEHAETSASAPATPVPEAANLREASQPETESVPDAQKAQEIQQLHARIATLVEENNALKQSQNRQVDPSEWKRVVAEKDATIHQLMEEGQALSKKELKLNERVRSLVQDNTALESSLKSYATKNEEVLLKLQEIEDVLHTHKLKSVEQLLEHLDDTRRKLAEAQASLMKEKNANWEAKYKELQALYEQELSQKKDAMKQLNESSLHLQMLENQTALALKAKDELIELLNQQIIMVKDESSLEISRLEGKIENLRLENENFLKMSQGDRASAPEAETAVQKQIDYAEYSRLSSSHRDLQAQYVSSQENWKTIESNLQSKILTILSSLESFKKAKLKATQEIRKLSNQLLEQAETISGLENALRQSKAENDELNLQLKIKKGEYAELEEKLEELRTVFQSDRRNYDLKIQSLTETIEKYEERDLEVLAFQSASTDNISGIHSRRLGDSGLHINLGHSSIGRHFSYNSMSLMNTPAHTWDERGEFPDLQDSRHQLDPRMSSTSFVEDYQTFDAPEGPDYSDNTKSATPTLPSFNNGNNNIQLINKMSSSIRRLEMELLSIKEENEELSHQKNEAQQEIVGKFELNSRVKELEASVAKLTEELSEKAKKEETLLEVIGEKSERVAELMADVEDLKDLCRQQVQQMIEMAEKSV